MNDIVNTLVKLRDYKYYHNGESSTQYTIIDLINISGSFLPGIEYFMPAFNEDKKIIGGIKFTVSVMEDPDGYKEPEDIYDRIGVHDRDVPRET